MSINACAGLVERSDPDRFLAAMAAPAELRGRLFVLYAFNLEVARAPWMTKEPMIAEMRLQWWRDAIEEIEKGGPVRAHEVSTPLAELIVETGIETDVLDRIVEARRWDIYKETFDDEDQLFDYLNKSGGGLMWASARALGCSIERKEDVYTVGRASALASWLMAVPELEARGWAPLPDGREHAVAALAGKALDELNAVKGSFGSANPALRAAWRARAILEQAANEPHSVAEGTLGGSEFARRAGLMWRTMRGTW